MICPLIVFVDSLIGRNHWHTTVKRIYNTNTFVYSLLLSTYLLLARVQYRANQQATMMRKHKCVEPFCMRSIRAATQ